MPKVCFLIPASPNDAFLSQIAAIQLALQKLPWTRWEPSVLVCFGNEPAGNFEFWRPHIDQVTTCWAAAAHFREEGVWAQSDAVLRHAPHDADVLLPMDADVLPVSNLEPVLDQVVSQQAVSGVMAHYPFPGHEGATSQEAWNSLAEGVISRPLEFNQSYSLMDPALPATTRSAPFYANFGVLFFPRSTYPDVISRLIRIRKAIAPRMRMPYFSGQVALTLAVTEAGVPVTALPMRYNFPNDEVAAARYPEELQHAVCFHYLRTEVIDRHRIFLSAADYHEFMNKPLAGANEVFRANVRRLFGPQYPFA